MPRICLHGVILLFIVCLFGCQSSLLSITRDGEHSILFETIALEEWGGGYESKDPHAFLLIDPADIAEIADFVKPEHLEQLHQVDFAQNAVIAVFRGIQPSSNYKIVIERINTQDALLTIHAQFWEPAPNQGGAAQETSPYHLVSVAKDRIGPLPTDVKLVSNVIQP